MHYNIIASTAVRIIKISPFGILARKLRIKDYRIRANWKLQDEEEERWKMQFIKKRHPSTLQPILPLVSAKPDSDEKDKAKFIKFDLLVRAGAAAGSTKYQKNMRTFEEGTPSEWIEVLQGVREIWKQNGVNGPSDRAATLAAILKGESKTCFDASLDDARINPDDEENPFDLSIEHVLLVMKGVTNVVFPHRSLEIQKLWMTRAMRKPAELTTRKTAAAITKINNVLPLFPLGAATSKFSEPEIVGLLEWCLPDPWRKTFDLKGYVPSNDTKEKLIQECEAIERSEVGKHDNNNNNKSDDKKNNKKNKFAKSESRKKKGEQKNNAFFCKECGRNASHATVDCYKLKNRAQRENNASGDGKAHAKPYNKRTFRKEANALARKAAKAKTLDLYAKAFKKEQGKQSKVTAKAAKKRAADPTDSESSGSDESMNNLESRIPRKKQKKTKVSSSLKHAPSTDDDDSIEEVKKPAKKGKVSFKKVSKRAAEDKVALEEKAFRAACEKEAQSKESDEEVLTPAPSDGEN